jgi:hypothetical protein
VGHIRVDLVGRAAAGDEDADPMTLVEDGGDAVAVEGKADVFASRNAIRRTIRS